MRRRRGEILKKFTRSQIILGARKIGKEGMFMAQMKNQRQHTTAEYYENLAIKQLQCLRTIAKAKGMTYDGLADITGISRTNIGRTLAGKNIPRLDTFMKLYVAITGEAYPDICDRPETEEVSHAVNLINDSDILSFEECLQEEVEHASGAGNDMWYIQSLIDRAKKSYESQFEV